MGTATSGSIRRFGGLALVAVSLAVAGCGSSGSSSSSSAATSSAAPAATSTSSAAPSSSASGGASGIPQGPNAGDKDSDNKGGPSDGDGNL